MLPAVSALLLSACSYMGGSSGERTMAVETVKGGSVTAQSKGDTTTVQPENTPPVKAYWTSSEPPKSKARPTAAAAPKPKHVVVSEPPVSDPIADITMPIMQPQESTEVASVAAPDEPAAEAAVNDTVVGSHIWTVSLIFGLFAAGFAAKPIFRKLIGAF